MGSGSIIDPQSWNRYSYTLNNPLAYIDPSGMLAIDTSDKIPWDKIDQFRNNSDPCGGSHGCTAYKGWQRITESNDSYHYVWNNNPNVHDAPYGIYQYVDTQGRVVVLNSDPLGETNGSQWHEWAIMTSSNTMEWSKLLTDKHTNDRSATPTGHESYYAVVGDLQRAGYFEHLDPHPAHWGGVNFWKHSGPTLNVELYTSSGCRGLAGSCTLGGPSGVNSVVRVEAHNERFNPDTHLFYHITRETIPHFFGFKGF